MWTVLVQWKIREFGNIGCHDLNFNRSFVNFGFIDREDIDQVIGDDPSGRLRGRNIIRKD